MLSSSYSYVVGPLVAFLALGVVLLLCRWTFSTRARDERTWRAQERARLSGDWGLLTPVALVDSRLDADLLRTRLREGGLRATVSPDGVGRSAVLVFSQDVERARELLARSS